MKVEFILPVFKGGACDRRKGTIDVLALRYVRLRGRVWRLGLETRLLLLCSAWTNPSAPRRGLLQLGTTRGTTEVVTHVIIAGTRPSRRDATLDRPLGSSFPDHGVLRARTEPAKYCRWWVLSLALVSGGVRGAVAVGRLASSTNYKREKNSSREPLHF